jgi:hypothetical protein
MDALTLAKNELITTLQTTHFEQLSQKEQTRLREYLEQIATTLQETTDLQLRRRSRQQSYA